MVILSRLKSGKSPFFPDRRHIHHKLLEMGLNEKDTVQIIYSVSIWFASMALVISDIPYSPIFFSISTLLVIFYLRRIINIVNNI